MCKVMQWNNVCLCICIYAEVIDLPLSLEVKKLSRFLGAVMKQWVVYQCEPIFCHHTSFCKPSITWNVLSYMWRLGKYLYSIYTLYTHNVIMTHSMAKVIMIVLKQIWFKVYFYFKLVRPIALVGNAALEFLMGRLSVPNALIHTLPQKTD